MLIECLTLLRKFYMLIECLMLLRKYNVVILTTMNSINLKFDPTNNYNIKIDQAI